MVNMNFSSPLVLRKFSVHAQPVEPEQPIVEIEGRKAGIIGFLLTIMRIENKMQLLITKRDVVFTSGGLFGQNTIMVPMTAVASAHSGYRKPVEFLAAALGLFSLGASLGLQNSSTFLFFIFLLLSICFIGAYALKKTLSLQIESSGGAMFGLVFKRSVIEGVKVDEKKVRAIVEIVREMVIASQSFSPKIA